MTATIQTPNRTSVSFSPKMPTMNVAVRVVATKPRQTFLEGLLKALSAVHA